MPTTPGLPTGTAVVMLYPREDGTTGLQVECPCCDVVTTGTTTGHSTDSADGPLQRVAWSDGTRNDWPTALLRPITADDPAPAWPTPPGI
ncbi:hypothetical protein [Kitasatospora sp. NPDC059160]|uniref:hypothetical protein n=1 Tax=Kitasatospora sp. NPDC059160 TaxID=3346748 RepID=UPI0036C85EA3